MLGGRRSCAGSIRHQGVGSRLSTSPSSGGSTSWRAGPEFSTRSAGGGEAVDDGGVLDGGQAMVELGEEGIEVVGQEGVRVAPEARENLGAVQAVRVGRGDDEL